MLPNGRIKPYPDLCSHCRAPILTVMARFCKGKFLHLEPTALISGNGDVRMSDGVGEVVGPEIAREEATAGNDVWRQHSCKPRGKR